MGKFLFCNFIAVKANVARMLSQPSVETKSKSDTTPPKLSDWPDLSDCDEVAFHITALSRSNIMDVKKELQDKVAELTSERDVIRRSVIEQLGPDSENEIKALKRSNINIKIGTCVHSE